MSDHLVDEARAATATKEPEMAVVGDAALIVRDLAWRLSTMMRKVWGDGHPDRYAVNRIWRDADEFIRQNTQMVVREALTAPPTAPRSDTPDHESSTSGEG